MGDQLTSLQQKVDHALVDIAKYEAEKFDLEGAQTGLARRGASARITKLQRLIKGAKLRLANAEKRFNEAFISHQQTLSKTADAPGPPPMSQGLTVAEPTVMTTENCLALIPNTVNEGADLSANMFSVPADGAAPQLSTDEDITTSLFVEAFKTPTHDAAPAEATCAADAGFIISPDPRTVPALEAQSSLDVSELHSTFKRIDHSDSEDNDDSSGKDKNMSLITAEDKTQLQQQLFERRYSAVPPPRKRTKYVDVSEDSDSKGDPNIFYDEDADERGPMEKAELAKPTESRKPVVAAQPMRLLPTNDGHRSKQGATATISKGKGREDDTEGGERKGAALLKGKNSKNKGRVDHEVSEKDKVINPDGKDKADYHASEYSVAKATRVAEALMKQQKRMTNEATHRQFVKEWPKAQSVAQRPEFPAGIDLVRFDPEYLPDVATANYNLTIELLLNNSNNYLCIPHVKLNRKLVSQIDNLEGPIQIWGTPLPQNQNSSIKTDIPRAPDHFHCGCHEKVALAGFVMWKTWKAKSFINGELVIEGLHKWKPFHPRDVLFILQFLKSKFGYTVEDMFTGSFDEEEERRKEAQVMKKVANFCARCHYELIGQTMKLDKEFPVLEEELKPEWI